MSVENNRGSLQGQTILITGIVDENSLACRVAREAHARGARLVCAGLGRTDQHGTLSERAGKYLEAAGEQFRATVKAEFGAETPALIMDATIDATLSDLATELKNSGVKLDGVLHSIAMDRTIRDGKVKPLLQVTRDEFMGAMDVSAYSLIAILRTLTEAELLARGASVVALSYIGAAGSTLEDYKNMGVAKAALERICKELAAEMGPSMDARINAVSFSPFIESRAGGAIPGIKAAYDRHQQVAPLGVARADDLAREVCFLMESDLRITGSVRYVDGGFHARV